MSQRQRTRDRSTQSIELHIESMVVEGLPRSDLREFAPAMQSELTRLFEEARSPSNLTLDREATLLRADLAPAAPGQRPRALGQQVADSVYRSLTDRQNNGGPGHER